jgi:nucleotide-binding universal stress UspA family protein
MKKYTIRNILVPTDFSPIARHALSHAERIARLMRAHVTLINAVEPLKGAFGTSGMLGVSSRLERKQEELNAARLRRMARAVEKRSGVRVSTLTVVGRVAPAITKAATKIRADLIIMGTHGASGFVENLLGSNTYRIASLAKTPLLSVHKNIGKSGYGHIVYPIREQSQAMRKFSHALAFAGLFGSRVHIIGLVTPEQEDQVRSMQNRCAAIQKRFTAHRIPADIAYTSKGFFPESALRHGHAHPDSLVVIAQDSDFYLVEVFQGVFSKKVLHSVLSPVLSIPNR